MATANHDRIFESQPRVSVSGSKDWIGGASRDYNSSVMNMIYVFLVFGIALFSVALMEIECGANTTRLQRQS